MGFGTLGSIGRGNVASQPIKYLFIDGGCLRATLADIERDYAGGQKLDIDFSNLTRQYSKVFYYDALPSKHSEESDDAFQARFDAVDLFHKRLGALDRFHVYEGDTRRSSSRRRQTQKKVDIMIAVDMLTHAFRRNMERATLLAGDLDFKPLIDALVNDGMFVTLWFPPNKTNPELISAADQREQLDVRSIYDSLKPQSKALFSLPMTNGMAGAGDPGTLLKSWANEDGDFCLYKSGEEFFISGPNANIGYRTYYNHANLDLLAFYARDVLQSPIPKD
ncbi:Uncharacterized conserved protein, LabA/DUF88 family [Bradyrhizobium erythrophlei]|nr:Uncharacterized conserved protein, LabA/DUF88 family [Bradyrhizobium erythrophlei]